MKKKVSLLFLGILTLSLGVAFAETPYQVKCPRDNSYAYFTGDRDSDIYGRYKYYERMNGHRFMLKQ